MASFPRRFPPFVRRATAALLLAVVSAAAQTAPPLQTAAPSPTPDAVIAQRRALREFDRFLDHHPLLEDELRLNPALRTDARFLSTNPDLRRFLATAPELPAALQTYPRYFLYRALLREALAPLKHSEIARLGELLDKDPEMERTLVRRPAAIRDAPFLAAHPLLRSFLQTHPPLDHVFLPTP
jgi:hypothetical protein